MKDSKEIAAMIKACSIETRGKLFLAIGKELRSQGQNFTASLFESIAHIYGVEEKAA